MRRCGRYCARYASHSAAMPEARRCRRAAAFRATRASKFVCTTAPKQSAEMLMFAAPPAPACPQWRHSVAASCCPGRFCHGVRERHAIRGRIEAGDDGRKKENAAPRAPRYEARTDIGRQGYRFNPGIITPEVTGIRRHRRNRVCCCRYSARLQATVICHPTRAAPLRARRCALSQR